MSSRFSTILVTAYTPASWGTTYIVTTELLPLHRPLLAGVIRALPSGLILLAFTRKLPHGAWWWKSVVLGALNVGVLFAFLFIAAERLPGGVAAIVTAISPLLVAIFSWPLLGMRPTGTGILAGIVGVGGVALLVLTPAAALDAVGLLAAVATTSVFALGTVLTKRWGRPASLVAFTGWQLAAGGLMLLPVMLLVEGIPDTVSGEAVGGFAYLAIANTALAYALWFRGIERLSATAVSFMLLLVPIVATLLGLIVLHQTLTPLQIFGMLLAFLGLVGGQLSEAARHSRARLPEQVAPAPVSRAP